MRAVVTEEYSIRFPMVGDHLDQDEEYFWMKFDNETETRVRLHDYDRLFSIPGLYESIFYDKLKCNSPKTIRSLLDNALIEYELNPSELRVLDIGAGNGMVGEQFVELGVKEIIGVDIIEEAALAADRDRPGIYTDFFVADLTELRSETRESLSRYGFNCLSSVAALGFGDIPPLAFAEAYSFISTPGWIAINIKDAFLSESKDVSGFCKLIRRMIKAEKIDVVIQHRYCHRVSLSGKPLYYDAIIARKRGEIPTGWFDGVE